MSNSTLPRGPGLFEIARANGRDVITNVRRVAGAERALGSVLIACAAWLLAALGAGLLFVSFAGQFIYIFGARHQDLASVIEALMFDVGMIIFSLLALGLARAGKPARTERTLIMACSFGSAAMNYAAADTASPRSVAAYVAAPVFLAVVVDRVVAVIRRHVLGDDEGSAWSALGRAAAAAVRLGGMILLYSLRFALAAPETARGLRRAVLEAAPLPQAVRSAPAGEHLPGESKTARFLALVQERHGELAGIDPAKVSRIAADLAPEVGLNAGSARSALLPRVRAAQNGGAS